MNIDAREIDANLNLTHIRRISQERSGKPTPGLLLLHGRGADETDLMGLESAIDPRFTVVSARAPHRLGPGFAWYGIGSVGSPDDKTMRSSLAQLGDFIRDMVPAYNIDPLALYLMGFSQGAVMSAAVALLLPERVRGVVMHSGYVPVEAGLDFRPDAVAQKPFFVAHGLYDDVIPISYGHRAREYLTGIGTRLTYQEYPIGHTISEESLDDFTEWLTLRNEEWEAGPQNLSPR